MFTETSSVENNFLFHQDGGVFIQDGVADKFSHCINQLKELFFFYFFINQIRFSIIRAGPYVNDKQSISTVKSGKNVFFHKVG